MASRTALLITAAMGVIVVVVVGALLPATALAAYYVVGDDSGWAPGVDYYRWVNDKTFHVGDTLEFVYSTEDNVVLVDVEGFETCTAPSDALTLTSGDDAVVFSGRGQFLFISGVEAHCRAGMQLIVNVDVI